MLAFLLVSICFFTLSIPLANTEPTTITVPGDYPTIQSAINAASPGDTILVAAGTYLENVILNKTVRLAGEACYTTIIDGDRRGTVVSATADNVSISGFTIRNGSSTGVYSGILVVADYANISGNIITSSRYGILLNNSSCVSLSSNNVMNNEYGVELNCSSNNVLLGNLMVSNQFNLVVWGSTLSHYMHSIDNSNLVDGRPVYYWTNQHGAEIPSDAGYVGLINSTEITVKNTALSNNGAGILLAYTHNSSITNNSLTNNICAFDLFSSNGNVISNNTVTNSEYGVNLYYSSYNRLLGNNVTRNDYGIKLFYSSNNTVYYNAFLSLLNQTSLVESTSVWDNGYPSGGNYWSDYTGVDLKSGPNQDQPGSDGLGDTPYIIGLDQDRYPLIEFIPIHDVAIANITPSKTVVGQGYRIYIDIEATNKGNRIETFNITVYINATILATQTVNNLTIGELSKTTFAWDTTGFAKSNYMISSCAWPVQYEINTADNNSTYSGIRVAVPGDINGDGKIGITDIVTIASAYGSKRDQTLFKPNADIDSDNDIDIYDVTIAASRYGYEES